MDLVINFNNTGVVLLNGAHFFEAKAVFQGALQVLLQLNCDGIVTQLMHPSIQRAVTISAQAQDVGQSTSVDEIIPDIDPFVCIRPMQLPDEENGDYNKNLASSTILFNIGLVHHLCGFENPSQMPFFAAMTRKFYQVAYDSVEAIIQNSSNDFVCDNTVILSLRLLNNMSQLLHELGEYNTLRSFLGKLSTQTFSAVGSRANIDPGEVLIFRINSMLLEQPKVAAAA